LKLKTSSNSKHMASTRKSCLRQKQMSAKNKLSLAASALLVGSKIPSGVNAVSMQSNLQTGSASLAMADAEVPIKRETKAGQLRVGINKVKYQVTPASAAANVAGAIPHRHMT